MARFALGAAFGVLVGIIGGAALGLRAEEEDPPIPAETTVTAIRAGLDARQLHGAVVSTGAPDAVTYLQAEGVLPRPPGPPSPPINVALERRLDCISWFESRHTPSARNPISGAAGQFQFLLSTWRTTPQGHAGQSPYDASAAREAARWMVSQGRIREWDVVRAGLC